MEFDLDTMPDFRYESPPIYARFRRAADLPRYRAARAHQASMLGATADD